MKRIVETKSPLPSGERKCLMSLLDSELDGNPIEFLTWRAKNWKKIPQLEELRRHGAIDGDTHCTVTFWGLLNTPGKRSRVVLAHCERLFRVLRGHYSDRPKEPIPLEALAAQAGLSPHEALTGAQFLARSPAHLVINSHDGRTQIFANETYVRGRGFRDIKRIAHEQGRFRLKAIPSIAFTEAWSGRVLESALDQAESDVVRECWQKAVERLGTDPAGAITSGRSLLEAACKYVLEEHGEAADTSLELPRLYKSAAKLIRLDSDSAVDAALRRMLQGCAAAVDGLGELRNKMGDAHGPGSRSARPARRHAEFAVMVAGAIAGLLLATLDAHRAP
jgi:hypothetical protein